MNDYNYSQIISNIKDRSDELNEWEIEFISSVHEWHVLKMIKLSDKQKKNVLTINRKYICKR